MLVFVDQALLLAHRDLHRDDLGAEAAVLDRLLRTGQRSHGKRILRFTGKAVALGAVFSKSTHQAATVVGVFQAVEEHVIQHPAMAHAVTAAGAVEQIRRVGHALHAPRHHYIGAAGQQPVVPQNRGFHARAAHLVQRGATGALVQPGTQGSLTRRCLAEAGRQHAAKQHLFHTIVGNTRALNRSADRRSTQLRRGQALEVALKAAHGRARSTYDYNRIITDCHFTPLISRPCARRRRDGSPRH